MTSRALTLSHQTRLVMNVIIEDDTGMLAFSLLLTTRLFTLFWHTSRLVASVRFELVELAQATGDLINAIGMAASIYLNVAGIVAKSFAFGMGVRV